MRILILSTSSRMASYYELVEALASIGVEATCVPCSGYCYLGENKPLDVLPTPRFLKIIKKYNPDLVLTNDPYHSQWLAKLVRRRLLYHMRGDPWSELYVDGLMYPSFSQRMYTRYLAAINDWSIKKTDLVLAVSKWLETRVREHMPNHPTQVLYVGIDPKQWDPRDNSKSSTTLDLKEPAVVGVFAFNQYAKVLGLLKFAKVIRAMKDVNFYFAGTGPYLGLARRESPSNTFFVGNLSRIQIKEFLEAADLFVHPSALDALPRSVKEASLMEKPIVASDEGGIPEIVRNGQTGYLCNIADANRWIERITYLLDNPSIGRRLGKNARKFVKDTFDWRKIGEHLITHLQDFTREPYQ